MGESVLKICRICLRQLDNNEHFNFLNDNSRMLLLKLLDFLSEIDLDFVPNPISCNQCTITINGIHEFKKLCMQTEGVIKDLQMQQKSFGDIINHVKKDSEIETIKEEFIEDMFEDELLIVDNDCLEVNKDLPVCIEVPTKFARHLDIHDLQVSEFKCDQCSYTTLNNSSLTAHKESHLKISCVQKNALKVNLKLHTREKQYKCDVCDYHFSKKSMFIRHIRTHTVEKLYSCNICNYLCNRKLSLKRHIRMHTKKTLYKCDVCNYRCNEKVHLKVHIRKHTGEKPYKCDVCDYRCTQWTAMKIHIRRYTGYRPLLCDKCDYKAHSKLTLTQHKKIHTNL